MWFLTFCIGVRSGRPAAPTVLSNSYRWTSLQQLPTQTQQRLRRINGTSSCSKIAGCERDSLTTPTKMVLPWLLGYMYL